MCVQVRRDSATRLTQPAARAHPLEEAEEEEARQEEEASKGKPWKIKNYHSLVPVAVFLAGRAQHSPNLRPQAVFTP